MRRRREFAFILVLVSLGLPREGFVSLSIESLESVQELAAQSQAVASAFFIKGPNRDKPFRESYDFRLTRIHWVDPSAGKTLAPGPVTLEVRFADDPQHKNPKGPLVWRFAHPAALTTAGEVLLFLSWDTEGRLSLSAEQAWASIDRLPEVLDYLERPGAGLSRT
jgi:hypothetical protein